MRSPWIVGEECPRPGTAVFQTTLVVSLHSTGGCCPASAMPFPSGPRHADQSPPWVTATDNTREPAAARTVWIRELLMEFIRGLESRERSSQNTRQRQTARQDWRPSATSSG